ncbi:DsbA family protein [Actinocorallia sp. A-T 12471]|uniref:DsbA family protein n=1 Tax=Actinocorallia sp. A-T 12471 TaxID=3089813 RepID=UPI0029D19F39|nr:thioredoxin domain-containing protein [Actinocorallia sp. A-T 12471]MDX6743024.1 thioredoxin domain-containing protein [Actinocorallia sp. A-T 12471]
MGKSSRERSARERIAEERRLQAKRDKQVKALAVGGGALALIAVAVGLVVLANSGGGDKMEYTGALAPTSRQDDGSVVMAKEGVTGPTVEVYEDFQCPACKSLEETTGATLKELAAQGKARVVYRPFRLFSEDPLKSNSERAANAALCAPGDNWVRFHDRLFAEQPKEGKVGFENSDLIAWAADYGISGSAFESCVNGNEKSAQVQAMTDHAFNIGKVQSTPTIMLDGKNITEQAWTPDDLTKAVTGTS